jgi:hypothetical protein
MLSCVQQILAFATFEVLEPNWRALEAKLAKVMTVDQLLKDHVDFYVCFVHVLVYRISGSRTARSVRNGQWRPVYG